MIKPSKNLKQISDEEYFVQRIAAFEKAKNVSELKLAIDCVFWCYQWKPRVKESQKADYTAAIVKAYDRIKARYVENGWTWTYDLPEGLIK